MKNIHKNTSVAESFLKTFKTDKQGLIRVVKNALFGAEDGELYLERSATEVIVRSEGNIESLSFSSDQGFGLRRVSGKQIGYVSSQRMSVEAIRNAGKELAGVFSEKKKYLSSEKKRPRTLYPQSRPKEASLSEKIAFLSEIDAYTRALDTRVESVDVSLVNQIREICIVRPDGLFVSELRPLVRLNISVVAKDGERSGNGSGGFGGRYEISQLFDPKNWKRHANRAVRNACDMLVAEDCPAGEMDVVLGPGWPGVILHEAFGHLTEGDFNFKGESIFASMMGRQVAAKGITVVDEGNISGKRGSLSFDDEGTPTQRTVLVKDGILVSYLHDRMSARQFGVPSTGNGRRESYACMPMPRMTNTHMLGGAHSPEDIIKNIEKGLYVEVLGGGQVDINTGKFVFSASFARLIENGKFTVPVKGATLIGSGPKVLLSVGMVGNDPALDEGVGTCGKNGQSVPVGVGQPTILIKKGGLVVGGSKLQVSGDSHE